VASTAGSFALYRSVPNFYQENNMSKMQLVKHALKLWNVRHVDKQTNRANARKWIASVERLGDRWLLAKKVERMQ